MLKPLIITLNDCVVLRMLMNRCSNILVNFFYFALMGGGILSSLASKTETVTTLLIINGVKLLSSLKPVTVYLYLLWL